VDELIQPNIFTRKRKLDPKKFFLSVLNLAVGTNSQGYFSALWKTWGDCNLDPSKCPVKSALHKARTKISFLFFKNKFDHILSEFESRRITHKGLKIYAIDGDQYTLPASSEVINDGYRGYTWTHSNGETHYPRMYLTHAYDVLSGVTKAIQFSPLNEEGDAAFDMASTFEENCLILYDRFFMSKKLIISHCISNSFFLVRLRKNGSNFSAVSNFILSNSRSAYFEEEGSIIRLAKVKNSRTKEDMIFATNLPEDNFSNKEIGLLYAKRWEVENSFRDLTSTLKLEQWHSKSINGILQELFALFWFYNVIKIELAVKNLASPTFESNYFYKRSNFKALAEFVTQNFKLLVLGRLKKLHRLIRALIEKTSEKRRRFSRTYPRQVKGSRKTYPYASIIKTRPRPAVYFEKKEQYRLERNLVRAVRRRS
jgi:hypothetical protein